MSQQNSGGKAQRGSRTAEQQHKEAAEQRDQQHKEAAKHTVVKAGGIFLFPRIFPSYFMKILQQIFRKNVLRSIN
jgi:hypothetical protein